MPSPASAATLWIPSARDYNVILGLTVFFGIFVVLCNILVDILYVLIDRASR